MTLEEIFYYDPSSPSGLCWKVDRIGGKGRIVRSAGDTVGTLGTDGYWRVNSKYFTMLAHRIIWELTNGVIPEGLSIDHIDQNPSNNVIENLRLIPHNENCRNRGIYSNNKTGVNGVNYFEPKNRSPRYTATWHEDGKLRSKSFSVSTHGEDAFNLAVAFRLKMIEQLNKDGANYSPNHGE